MGFGGSILMPRLIDSLLARDALLNVRMQEDDDVNIIDFRATGESSYLLLYKTN